MSQFPLIVDIDPLPSLTDQIQAVTQYLCVLSGESPYRTKLAQEEIIETARLFLSTFYHITSKENPFEINVLSPQSVETDPRQPHPLTSPNLFSQLQEQQDISFLIGTTNNVPFRGFTRSSTAAQAPAAIWLPEKRQAALATTHTLDNEGNDTRLIIGQYLTAYDLDPSHATYSHLNLECDITLETEIKTRRALQHLLDANQLAQPAQPERFVKQALRILTTRDTPLPEHFQEKLEQVARLVTVAETADEIRRIAMPLTPASLATVCDALQLSTKERDQLVAKLALQQRIQVDPGPTQQGVLSAQVHAGQESADWSSEITTQQNPARFDLTVLLDDGSPDESNSDQVNMANCHANLDCLCRLCNELHGNDSDWQRAAEVAQDMYTALEFINKVDALRNRFKRPQ